MPVRLIWKSFMFLLSIAMLLLVLGFGQTPVTKVSSNTAIFSGQAKVARPGARTAGFKAVNPAAPPVVEKTIWDKARDTMEAWMGGGEMAHVDTGRAERTALQDLQRRASGQGTATTMATQTAERLK